MNKVLKTIFKQKCTSSGGASDIGVPFIIYAIYSRCFERLQKKRPASLADKFITILQKFCSIKLIALNV